jgi:tetratricopeptide (TPR) repeat protein
VNIDSTLGRRMTKARDISQENRFVPVVLPWLIAGGALLFYLLTLNHWVTFNNLPQVSRAAGWNWQGDFLAPLTWLITLAFRCLPAGAVPLALNLFSAVCAALTLALLARSIALLPHDRTEEQRIRERGPFAVLSLRNAWIPPVFAAIVCGLQLTFWERATSAFGWLYPPGAPMASNQMLDLLIFAYVIRCLLEFRIDNRESWLTRASVVYGLAMTNNWAMIGFFPLFLVALVWLRGLAFFNVRFLVRMFLWGLLGLSLYLLLPLVRSVSDISHVSFWTALRANLQIQKFLVMAVPFNKSAVVSGDSPLWILALPSLLPILIISIRWPSYFGDPSKLGVALATSIFHLFHGVMLLVCVWVALDPRFSPRHHSLLSATGLPGLSLYYLGALAIGYFVGYFLLVFGRKPSPPRTLSEPMRLLSKPVLALVWLVMLAAPVVLLYRNLPQIRITNGPMLKEFAAAQAQALPAQGAFVLCDDTRRLTLLRAFQTQTGQDKKFVYLETGSLKLPDYQRVLHQRYPQQWKENPAKDRTEPYGDLDILGEVGQFSESQSNAICYLHPSFGYYFEAFYPEPHGLVYYLKKYSTNSMLAPPLGKDLVQENEEFWTRTDEKVLQPLVAAIAPPAPVAQMGTVDRLLNKAHLKREPNPSGEVLATFYSRALDAWGVQLQRNDQFALATPWFNRAHELNPDNVASQINLEFNRNYQAGTKPTPEFAKSIEDQFGKYRTFEAFLNANGPVDDPDLCYPQGLVFARGRNVRQAAQEFYRVKQLAPENLNARLWLAELYLLSGRPEPAIQEVSEIRADDKKLGLSRTNETELLNVEASAYLAHNELDKASAAVHTTLQKYPNDGELLAMASQVYMNHGRFTNALEILNQELALEPNNAIALINKGYACLQVSNYQEAIPPLTRALELQTNNLNALFNRAIAYLQCNKLDEAQRDYEILQKAYPTEYRVYYGLGEIAYRKKDTNAAIRSYQLYLTNAPPGLQEAKDIAARLAELQHPGSTNHPVSVTKPNS